MQERNEFTLITIDNFSLLIIFIIFFLIIVNILLNSILNIKITVQQDYFLTLSILYGSIFMWLKIILNNSNIKLKKITGKYSLNDYFFKILLLGIIFTVFSAGIFDIYLNILSCFSQPIPSKIMKILNRYSLKNDYIFFTINRIIVILIAPVIEEFFRIILLHKLGINYGIKKAVITTSIIFAVLHLNVLGGFVFSLIASLLYIKHGKILIPIMLHIINNSINTLSMYLEKININLANILLLKFLPYCYSIFFLILLFIILVYIIYSNWNELQGELPYYM